MRVAYWDCFSGIAGDMILGALVGCGLGVDELRQELAGLALHGYRIEHRRVRRGSLAADKIDVVIEADGAAGGDHHHHRGLRQLRQILEDSELAAGVAEDAERVFLALCEAEAEVHGVALEEVRLHDVGAIDAIVDIVGACAGLRRLQIDSLTCSPLNVGGGQVASAHGSLPVPAPATARLLSGAPVYARGPAAELVTPTGAALAATLSDSFGGWPEVTLVAVGYGAGDHEFGDFPNVLRMAIGDAATERAPLTCGHSGPVSVIETNIDDMSPQLFGSVVAQLLEAGALDAYTTPVFMKKNRPGVLLTVLTLSKDVDRLADLIFRQTTTLGLRTYPVGRRELHRRHVVAATPWGQVRVKVARLGGTVVTCTPEYDDCEALARASGVPLKKVLQAATSAFKDSESAPESPSSRRPGAIEPTTIEEKPAQPEEEP
ncbi:MAG: nickel pincer cofactor biosynthesis protein LarC [Acidobacteriota bacterium]